MEKNKISEGVNFTSISTNKFSTECLSLSFLLPIKSINPSFTAILPHVLLSGSKNYPNREEIGKKLDFLYGAKIEPIIRKKGEFLCMTFICDVIDGKFAKSQNLIDDIFNMLCEIIYNPLVTNGCFDANILESEKENLINRINGIKNDKRTYANIRMFELMCKNEPFGINSLGTVESAKNISSTSLFENYNYIINNAQIEIFYCGSSDVKSLDLRKIKARPTQITKVENTSYNPNPREFVECMNISQGKLSMGFRTNILATDDDYPALVLFNTIFGGSTTSKLFENVREKMSLCYYASSSHEKIKGVMSVNSGIEVQNFQIAKDAILEQFYDMQKGNFEISDINSAKLTILNNLNSAKDSKYALEDFYLGQTICSNEDDIDDLIKNIDKVSKQEIVDAALKVKLDTIFFLKGDENND